MHPRSSKFLIVWLLGLLILAGCVTSRRKVVQKTAIATPIPPPELLALPTNAQIRCPDDPQYRSRVTLWELPGLEPVDSDSGTCSNTGEYLGAVKECSVVTITDYAWSETDQEFYVYVIADPDQELCDSERTCLKGWLLLRFVDLSP